MINSQILNERPFNLNDGDFDISHGELYFVELNGVKVFRKIMGRKHYSEVFTSSYQLGSLFQDPISANKVIEKFKAHQKHQEDTFDIIQVKDRLIPKYYVGYKPISVNNDIPSVECKIVWSPLRYNEDCTFLDYEAALKQLDRYKSNVIELCYEKIMQTKKIQLKKI